MRGTPPGDRSIETLGYHRDCESGLEMELRGVSGNAGFFFPPTPKQNGIAARRQYFHLWTLKIDFAIGGHEQLYGIEPSMSA